MSVAPRARVGWRVSVHDGQQQEDWRIVPTEDADASRGRISEDCPLARAVLGHGVGEVVRLHCPGGTRSVTLLGVEP